jgi:hypothetical protein
VCERDEGGRKRGVVKVGRRERTASFVENRKHKLMVGWESLRPAYFGGRGVATLGGVLSRIALYQAYIPISCKGCADR